MPAIHQMVNFVVRACLPMCIRPMMVISPQGSKQHACMQCFVPLDETLTVAVLVAGMRRSDSSAPHVTEAALR
jgi:hypothetical protein